MTATAVKLKTILTDVVSVSSPMAACGVAERSSGTICGSGQIFSPVNMQPAVYHIWYCEPSCETICWFAQILSPVIMQLAAYGFAERTQLQPAVYGATQRHHGTV